MSGGTTIIFQKTFGSALDEKTVAMLRNMAKRCTYPPGTVLCHQGQVENTFYIIVEGRVVVTQKQEDGSERFLASLGPNEYFGEMGLLDNTPRSATCITAKASTLFEVTSEVFSEIVEKSPAVAFAIAQRVLATLRHSSANAIQDLRKKNEELEKAYSELKKAQESLVEKKKLERELELAAEMQGRLLPKTLPQFPDYSFSAYQKAARHVGGDLFNVFTIDEEHVGFLIGDVADKGFQAALFMAIAQTLFCREGRRSLSANEVTRSVHAGLLEVAPTSDVFVTAFYGVLHRPSGRMRYVRAGHEHPLLLRPGQPVSFLPGQGRFLGMVEEITLQEENFDLRAGDRVVLYSDGVTDATDPAGKMFGKERLVHLLAGAEALSAEKLVQRILKEVEAWGKGTPAFDDLTLLVIEMR